MDHARRKVEAGSAPKIEIVRAEAGLAGRLEDVINAETSVRDRERELKRILNRDDLPLGNRAAQARLRRARLEKVRDQIAQVRLARATGTLLGLGRLQIR